MSLYVTYEFMNLEALFRQYLVYKSIVSSMFTIVSSTSRKELLLKEKRGLQV